MERFRAKQGKFLQSKCGFAKACKPAKQGIPKSKAFWEKGVAIRTVKPFLNENGEPKGFAATWRRGWDSNPRDVSVKRISSASRLLEVKRSYWNLQEVKRT